MCLSAAKWGGHGALPGTNRTDNDYEQIHFTVNSLPFNVELTQTLFVH